MDRVKKRKIYCENHKHSCYITDLNTYECLYANEEFFRVYDLSKDIIGSNFLTNWSEAEKEAGMATASRESPGFDENSTIVSIMNTLFLHQLGCHLGQGYFYSPPVPVEDFEKEYRKEVL